MTHNEPWLIPMLSVCTRESGRLPGEVTCGENKSKKENDARVSSEQQSVCRLRGKKKHDTCFKTHQNTHTRTHTRRTHLPAPPPSTHTPLMFQGVKKTEKHLQPNHFRSLQRFLSVFAKSLRVKVSAGNPTLLEVTLRQWGANTLVSDVFPALGSDTTTGGCMQDIRSPWRNSKQIINYCGRKTENGHREYLLLSLQCSYTLAKSTQRIL